MTDLARVTKSLGEIVVRAAEEENEEPVELSAVLETFSSAVLESRDPVMREAFLEACLDVLKPQGDASDKGRLAVLHGSALTCIPSFLPLVSEQPELVKQFLSLIAQHGEPREVVLALNMQVGELAEQADPYAVSDSEDEENDTEIDWQKAFPQLQEMLDMYAVAIPRLKTQRSTPTLLSLQDSLVPLLKAIPTSAPPELAVDMSRSLIKRVSHLAEVAWTWSQGTGDTGGEQKAVLTDIVQIAVMIFGPNVCADLTPRWFLAMYPRFAGLHAEDGWQDGQAALDAAITACETLGIDQAGFVERIRSSSSVRPQSSIASLILLAASLPPLQQQAEKAFSPPSTTLEDAMPVLSICLNGSAVDAGTALAWSLVEKAKTGACAVEFDQVTFLLEHVMPLIQINQSPNTRLALSKLLGAMIAAVKPASDQIRLFEQILEPINPFENIRVLALSLLREQLAAPPHPSPLLCKQLTEMLTPILFRHPRVDSPLDLPLPKLMESFWPVWLTECANLVWFLVDLDRTNASGFSDQTNLTTLRNLWLLPIKNKAEVWLAEGKQDSEVELVLDRLVDACTRANAAIDGATGR